MSTEKSQAQPTVAVDESDTFVVDSEGAEDEVCRALTNERRRHVLSAVRREPMEMDTEDLTRRVTIREAHGTSKVITEASIHEVQISIYHHHLPMVADLGIGEYDPEANVVTDIAGTLR